MKNTILDGTPDVNVFDISTNEIVFSGTRREAEKYLRMKRGTIAAYIKTKYILKGKYAIRPKTE